MTRSERKREARAVRRLAKSLRIRAVGSYGGIGGPARSSMAAPVQDARKDLTRGTRLRLLANSRELVRRNPLVDAIIERIITYTVGTGILVESDSADEAFRARADAYYAQFAERPEITSDLCAAEVQAIILRAAITDGDIFGVKTVRADANIPALQLIEAHNVGDPAKAQSTNYSDGVALSADGAPVAYSIRTAGDKFVDIPVGDVVKFANTRRIGQHRGVCVIAAALDTAIDLDDILGAEKGQVKAAGIVSDIVKTASGEIDAEDLLRGANIADASGDATRAYYEQVIGPQVKVMRNGDSYEPYEPKRPGPAWQGFVDFLAELVCLAFNLPPSLVRQLKVGGADTRRDLAAGQRTFELLQLMLSRAWRQVYEYVIEYGIQSGELGPAPADWRKCSFQFPRAATVDAGRQAQQDREDVRAGTMSLSEYWGQYGMSVARGLAQLKREFETVMRADPSGGMARRLYGDDGRAAFVRSLVETYGVAVRAGSLTPNLSDEAALRAKLGLPEASADVLRVWQEDGGARKPITIQAQETQNANNAQTAQGVPAQ